MLRSKGSQSRFWVMFSNWSRDRTRFGMLDEHLQQVEFHPGQDQLVSPLAKHPPRRHVEFEAGNAQPRRRRRRERFRDVPVPAQDALDPRQQLARLERLGHVVVGPDLEADDPVQRLCRARDHDDGDVELLADVPRQAQAVLAGHADVQEHEVGGGLAEAGPRLRSIACEPHFEALLAEIVPQQLAHDGIVVHDQEYSFRILHGHLARAPPDCGPRARPRQGCPGPPRLGFAPARDSLSARVRPQEPE
jgi:hypothetical protein